MILQYVRNLGTDVDSGMQKPAHSKPETAFYSLDTSRQGITQVQLAQLLCSLYSFQKSDDTRQAAMQLRRLLAEAYRQLKVTGQTSEAISWKQVSNEW